MSRIRYSNTRHIGVDAYDFAIERLALAAADRAGFSEVVVDGPIRYGTPDGDKWNPHLKVKFISSSLPECNQEAYIDVVVVNPVTAEQGGSIPNGDQCPLEFPYNWIQEVLPTQYNKITPLEQIQVLEERKAEAARMARMAPKKKPSCCARFFGRSS